MKKKKKNIPNKSLQKKLLMFSLMLILIISVISVLMVINLIQAINTYDKMLESINLINKIQTNVSTMDAAVQEYSISRNSKFREIVSNSFFNTVENLDELDTILYSEKSKLIYVNFKSIYNDYYHQCIKFMDFTIKSHTELNLLSEYNQISEIKNTANIALEKLMQSELQNNDIFYNYIQSKTSMISIIFFLILLLTVFLSILFAWGFSKDIYKPIHELVVGAEKIAIGDFEFEDIPHASTDEIGYLTQVFNTMKKDLSKWINDKEEQAKLETLLKEAELKALQAQVNPHFLFNVLSIITESVLQKDTEYTLSVVEKITYLLRYSLTSFHKEVSLSEELKMVEAYIYLQEKRFGDRISFSMDFPIEVPDIIIPSMTIQPMVENAIIHGTEKMIQGGRIEVSLVEDEQDVAIHIKDNGQGIKKDILDEILMNRGDHHKGDTTGIGIFNVKERLSIFYGKNDVLIINSEDKKGTHVEIRYPKNNRTS